MTPRLLLLVSLMAACSARPGPVARPSDERAAGLEANASSRREHAEVRQGLAARILEVKGRLTPELEIPADKAAARCPAVLGNAHTDKTVAVRIHDARYEPRSLLPLEFRSRLESDELVGLGAQYVGGTAALWNLEAAELRSPDSAREIGRLLDSLDQKRYAAVLHVTTYSKPDVFRRKDAIRPEWNAGAIGARFVVYDLDRRVPLCEESLAVRGEGKDAPLRRRLRESTRTRLHRVLRAQTWQAMRDSL